MKSLFTSALVETVQIHASIENRVDVMELRVGALKFARDLSKPLVKTAFDTRRTNQYTDFNPRRNLQHYHRSEAFITKDSSEKIKTLFKLKTAVDSIKEDFVGDPEWLDSYCRILSAAVDRTLRVDQKDMDFSRHQMDYLEELLYLRYRIKDDDIVKLNEKELRNIILDKDEKLAHRQIYSNYSMNKHSDLRLNSNDNVIEKLFGSNGNVDRSITITVKNNVVGSK